MSYEIEKVNNYYLLKIYMSAKIIKILCMNEKGAEEIALLIKNNVVSIITNHENKL